MLSCYNQVTNRITLCHAVFSLLPSAKLFGGTLLSVSRLRFTGEKRFGQLERNQSPGVPVFLKQYRSIAAGTWGGRVRG